MYIGAPALLQAFNTTVPEALSQAALEAGNRGQAAIYLVEKGAALAVFVVADVVRPESEKRFGCCTNAV